jgi:branched-chain amino acid transport system ATP-binding protein
VYRPTTGTITFDEILELFPPLVERRGDTAGYLSGGEQQMVAIGRALMAKPRLLVLDEPSLGLAPLIVEQIGRIITDINDRGTSVLLVEQNAMMALGIADHAYVVETGRIVRSGPAPELREDTEIQEFYLGISSDGRTSFREVASYPPAKAWRL